MGGELRSGQVSLIIDLDSLPLISFSSSSSSSSSHPFVINSKLPTFHTSRSEETPITMSADVANSTSEDLSKVDSAVSDVPASPSESKIKHRRTSSTVSGVFNINDLGK